MPPRPVVAAAIVDSLARPTNLLCTARAYPQALRGQYELPGGKVEKEESRQEALHRELVEELGIEVRLGRQICPNRHRQWWPILQGRIMWVWWAEITAGEPTLTSAHEEMVWANRLEVPRLPWLPTNRPIAEHIQSRLYR